MALFECFSGNGIDILNPDVVHQETYAAGTSGTITTAQKARYIIFSLARADGATPYGVSILGVCDVEKNKFKEYYFGGGGTYGIRDANIGTEETIESVTDNSIVVNFHIRSYPLRFNLLAYY